MSQTKEYFDTYKKYIKKHELINEVIDEQEIKQREQDYDVNEIIYDSVNVLEKELTVICKQDITTKELENRLSMDIGGYMEQFENGSNTVNINDITRNTYELKIYKITE